MMKNLLAIASSALAVTLAIPTQAGQIFIAGTPLLDTVKFTAEPLNSLRVSAPLGFDGNATYVPDIGPMDTAKVQFGLLDFFTGSESAGVFTAIPPADQTFNYQSISGSDQLTADITWSQVVANAPLPGEPQLVGTALITSSSGDPSFMTDDFPAGSTINIAANFPLGGGCDLTQLATMVDCTATFEFASFEGTDALTPGTPPLPPPPPPLIETPEPMSSLMGLGIALFCLWGAYRLTRRQPGPAMS
jgi:hypothetical protein